MLFATENLYQLKTGLVINLSTARSKYPLPLELDLLECMH